MNESYRELVRKAVDTSLSLGLLQRSEAPSFSSGKIAQSSIFGHLGEFNRHLHSLGFRDSRSLSGHCIQIHDHLQMFLQHHGVESHITIGSMHGHGWAYCSVPMDHLLAELKDPDLSGEVRVHTWLTLNDASILDWTGQAWYDTQTNENHPAESCLVYFAQGEQDESHYYNPVFVGREYLVRTGSIRRVVTC